MIVTTPGREQPYAVWKGTRIYRFFHTRDAAEHYENELGMISEEPRYMCNGCLQSFSHHRMLERHLCVLRAE